MYDRIKVLFTNPTYRYFIIGGIGVLILVCLGYIFYQPSGADYQRTLNAVERAQEQQRESVELNRRVQYSIERVSDLTRETGERIDRSQEYNQQINDRIGQSQSGLSEARSYLVKNGELFDRVERESRERQSNNQETQDATQPISDGRRGSSNRSSDSSVKR